MRNAVKATLTIVAAVAVSACGKDFVMSSPTTVEIDVFSGRPHPSWTLTPEEEAELQKHLADLAPVKETAEPPPLGYRGFVLESPEGTVRLYGGTLRVFEKNGATRRYGNAEALEKWLADLAARRGHGGLVTLP